VTYPKPLKKGDKIALIAPAGIVCEQKIKQAVGKIRKMGLIPVLGKNVYEKHGYFAGTDDLRAGDFNRAFSDDRIKGVFCLRGGYGANRILDKINWDAVKENPKVFVGYSDITALHIAINQICGFVTYHGPMAATELLQADNTTLQSLGRSIFGKKNSFKLENPSDTQPVKQLVSGSFSGIITGGNLSLITASLGTKYEICTANKILFIEEVSEPVYKIDRMLTQLKNAGKLDEVTGVVLGQFSNVTSTKDSLTLDQVLEEIFVPIGKPVICDFACGHQMPTMTIPLGGFCEGGSD